MAKKKSKRFIIPASHFITTTIEEKLDIPVEIIRKPVNAILNEQSSDYVKNKYIQDQEKNIKAPEKENIKAQRLIPGNNLRRNSALSLSSLKRNKIEEKKLKSRQKVVEDIDNLPKDPFTEETFLKIWYAYIEDLHDKGEKIFASILKADAPKIKKNIIFVTYPNEMMKAELIKVKPKALKYLRQKLNNFSIDFNISVNEGNTKKFAYTPQEKYDLLKEKNKSLINLRKTFNLDL